MQPDWPPPNNGILASVPGQYIAQGQLTLPSPEDRTEPMTVELDADWVGRVRITYWPYSYRHRRNTFWAWAAKHAEKVATPPPAPPARA